MSRGYRQGRLGEEIRKIISEMLLRELKDPRLAGKMISISDVEVTSDNSYATCYVTVLDTDRRDAGPGELTQQEKDVLDGLKSSQGAIRNVMGKRLNIRRVPELVFRIDHSFEYGAHIDEVLKNLEK